MSSNINDAIQLIKSGNKKEALNILRGIIQEEPKNEMAWLLLSACVDSAAQKRYFLQKVLEINPTNLNAINELQKLPAQIPPSHEAPPSPITQKQNIPELLQSQSEQKNSYLVQQKISTSQQASCPDCHGYKIEKVTWVNKRTGKELKPRFGCLPTIGIIILTTIWFFVVGFVTSPLADLNGQNTPAPVLIMLTPIALCPYLPFLFFLFLDIYRRVAMAITNKVQQYRCGICGRIWRADGLPVRLKR